jgi:FXSXX-COOH protein
VDAAGATDDAAGWQSVMVDVSDLSLTELAADDDSVLAQCLRRLAGDLERPDGPIAGFNSAF